MKRAAVRLPLGFFLLSAGLLLASGGVYYTTKHGNAATGAFRLPDVPRGECGQCHDQHASRLGAPTGGPFGFVLFQENDNALCASCHSTSGTFSFYPGITTYNLSSHATSASAVWPGSVPPARPFSDAGKCVNCHDPHGVRDATGLIPAMAFLREESLCDPCHDGSPALRNVRAQFQKSYRHPAYTTANRHAEGENTASAFASPSARHSECEDCHNPHVATADLGAPTAPAASNRLLGVSRIRVTNGPAGTVPSYTAAGPGDLSAPREHEICFKCHSSWTTQPAGQSDLALLFNSNNPSFHPVEGAGKNLNIRAGAFVVPWTFSSTTFCTDCHTSDDTAVRGPHGSSNPYILRRPYTASPASRVTSSTELCFLCHNYDTYANDQSSDTVKGTSRFNRPQYAAGHTFHVDQKRYPCYSCHASHGSATRPALVVTGRNPGLTNYTQTAMGGTCTPTCHGAQTYTLNYAR